jgi:hypothetical protein
MVVSVNGNAPLSCIDAYVGSAVFITGLVEEVCRKNVLTRCYPATK